MLGLLGLLRLLGLLGRLLWYSSIRDEWEVFFKKDEIWE